jgi:stearoyl-CoA desaturase (delta-9 desaturase)
MIIILFFIGHWYISLFFQTFFLHRYTSHRMFKMNSFWEKTFFFLTFLVQGSSFLQPAAYGAMHRRHHSFSDTKKDPHSPVWSNNIFSFMWGTFKEYRNLSTQFINDDSKSSDLPRWKSIEILGESMIVRLLFIIFYSSFYWIYAPSAWFFILIPFHIFMGPIHGFIVNWFGHKNGYRNHPELLDLLMMGELYQNNHHKSPNKPKFSHRWFELDLGYLIIQILNTLKVIRLV